MLTVNVNVVVPSFPSDFETLLIERLGSVDSASVVTVKVSVTPPMFSVVFLAVDQLEDEVCLTVTVSPLFTVLLES
jgi:hypothetical protein